MGVTWASDNTIFFGQGREGIFRVSGDGGTAERIIQVKPSESAHGPQLLPDGHTVLVTLASSAFAGWNDARLVTQSLDTGTRKEIFSGGTDARYVQTGHIICSLNDTVLAVPFDASRLELTGGPVSLIEEVAQTPGGQTGAAQFSTNDAGSLVYIPQSGTIQARASRTLAQFDRKGSEHPLPSVPKRTYRYPRFSHDGKRVALDIQDEERDVWIWPLATGTLTRLTLESTQEQYALWTADDAHIVFPSSQGGVPNLFWVPSNGNGKMQRLTDSPNPQFPQAITNDGTLIFREDTPNEGSNIMLMSLQGDRSAKPVIVTKFNERNAEVSPDGRWLAYESNKSGGRDDVFVTNFGETGKGEWQSSPGGGTRPVRASDSELLYVQPMPTGAGRLMSVSVSESNGAFQHRAQAMLFDLDSVSTVNPRPRLRRVARRTDDPRCQRRHGRRGAADPDGHPCAELFRGREAPRRREVSLVASALRRKLRLGVLDAVRQRSHTFIRADRAVAGLEENRRRARGPDAVRRPRGDDVAGAQRHDV